MTALIISALAAVAALALAQKSLAYNAWERADARAGDLLDMHAVPDPRQPRVPVDSYLDEYSELVAVNSAPPARRDLVVAEEPAQADVRPSEYERALLSRWLGECNRS